MPIYVASGEYIMGNQSIIIPMINMKLHSIYNTQGNKRILLTPEEFGKNLKILFGKTQQRNTVTLDDFRKALSS